MTGIDRARLADIVSAAGLELGKDVHDDYRPDVHSLYAPEGRVVMVRSLPALVAFLGEASRQCDVDEYEDLFGEAEAPPVFLHEAVTYFPRAKVIDF